MDYGIYSNRNRPESGLLNLPWIPKKSDTKWKENFLKAKNNKQLTDSDIEDIRRKEATKQPKEILRFVNLGRICKLSLVNIEAFLTKPKTIELQELAA